jgi:hypothetical protein
MAALAQAPTTAIPAAHTALLCRTAAALITFAPPRSSSLLERSPLPWPDGAELQAICRRGPAAVGYSLWARA